MSEISLQHYFERLLADMDRRLSQHMRAIEIRLDQRIKGLEEAFRVDKHVQDERLGKMNELREQFNQRSDTFVTIPMHEVIRDRLEKLERQPVTQEAITNIRGRLEKLERIPWALGIVFAVVQVGLAVILKMWHP